MHLAMTVNFTAKYPFIRTKFLPPNAMSLVRPRHQQVAGNSKRRETKTGFHIVMMQHQVTVTYEEIVEDEI
jgi:hypothetical protein